MVRLNLKPFVCLRFKNETEHKGSPPPGDNVPKDSPNAVDARQQQQQQQQQQTQQQQQQPQTVGAGNQGQQGPRAVINSNKSAGGQPNHHHHHHHHHNDQSGASSNSTAAVTLGTATSSASASNTAAAPLPQFDHHNALPSFEDVSSSSLGIDMPFDDAGHLIQQQSQQQQAHNPSSIDSSINPYDVRAPTAAFCVL